MCSTISRNQPLCVPFLLILLSNDVELNSLSKNNFERVQLLEAHNSLFDYDLISICETSLNSEIEIPDPLMNKYKFITANHPGDVSHGGVGLFYKNSLPLEIQPDLAFDEIIVVELKFGRKNFFSQFFTEVLLFATQTPN